MRSNKFASDSPAHLADLACCQMQAELARLDIVVEVVRAPAEEA